MIESLAINRIRKSMDEILEDEDRLFNILANLWARAERAYIEDLETLGKELIVLNQKGGGPVTQENLLRMERFKIFTQKARQAVLNFVSEAISPIEKFEKEMAVRGTRDAISVLKVISGDQIVFKELGRNEAEMLIADKEEKEPLKESLDEIAFSALVLGVIQAAITTFTKMPTGNTAGAAGVDEVVSGALFKLTAEVFVNGASDGLQEIYFVVRNRAFDTYRKASFNQYKQHNGVVRYMRLSAKDTSVCPGCLFMDGKPIDSIDGSFEEHKNGRCVAVPIIKGFPEPSWETGEEWFLKQEPDIQEKILGPGRFKAWRDGVGLEEMVRRVESADGKAFYTASRVRDL